jgi:hypothetical protein
LIFYLITIKQKMSFGQELKYIAFNTFITYIKDKLKEDAKEEKRKTTIYFSDNKDLKDKFVTFSDVLNMINQKL